MPHACQVYKLETDIAKQSTNYNSGFIINNSSRNTDLSVLKNTRYTIKSRYLESSDSYKVEIKIENLKCNQQFNGKLTPTISWISTIRHTMRFLKHRKRSEKIRKDMQIAKRMTNIMNRCKEEIEVVYRGHFEYFKWTDSSGQYYVNFERSGLSLNSNFSFRICEQDYEITLLTLCNCFYQVDKTGKIPYTRPIMKPIQMSNIKNLLNKLGKNIINPIYEICTNIEDSLDTKRDKIRPLLGMPTLMPIRDLSGLAYVLINMNNQATHMRDTLRISKLIVDYPIAESNCSDLIELILEQDFELYFKNLHRTLEVGYYESGHLSINACTKAIDNSLGDLGCDRVALYAIHMQSYVESIEKGRFWRLRLNHGLNWANVLMDNLMRYNLMPLAFEVGDVGLVPVYSQNSFSLIARLTNDAIMTNTHINTYSLWKSSQKLRGTGQKINLYDQICTRKTAGSNWTDIRSCQIILSKHKNTLIKITGNYQVSISVLSHACDQDDNITHTMNITKVNYWDNEYTDTRQTSLVVDDRLYSLFTSFNGYGVDAVYAISLTISKLTYMPDEVKYNESMTRSTLNLGYDSDTAQQLARTTNQNPYLHPFSNARLFIQKNSKKMIFVVFRVINDSEVIHYFSAYKLTGLSHCECDIDGHVKWQDRIETHTKIDCHDIISVIMRVKDNMPVFIYKAYAMQTRFCLRVVGFSGRRFNSICNLTEKSYLGAKLGVNGLSRLFDVMLWDYTRQNGKFAVIGMFKTRNQNFEVPNASNGLNYSMLLIKI